jgi:hypothetical protein
MKFSIVPNFSGAKCFFIYRQDALPLGDGDRANAISKDDISVKLMTFFLERMLKPRDVGTGGAVNLKIFNPDGIQLDPINPP